MKKTLITLALASISATAFACGPNCPADASVSAGGTIAGGASNSVSAFSGVVGTGSSVSNANSSTYSGAGLTINAASAYNDRNGTESVTTSVQSYTMNQATAGTSTQTVGSGAVGSANADAQAGSAVMYGVAGNANAGSGHHPATTATVIYDGVEASGVTATSSSNSLHPNQIGSVVSNAGTVLNAIGGVAVQNCKDIQTISAYYSDAKDAGTSVVSTGHASGTAAAGATAGGVYFGSTHN
jgi:hypothetical protein